MSKYRKIPVEIEAIQWTGDNYTEIYDFVNNSKNDNLGQKMNKLLIKSLQTLVVNRKKISIETLEGKMIVNVGDYIIKGVERRVLPLQTRYIQKNL